MRTTCVRIAASIRVSSLAGEVQDLEVGRARRAISLMAHEQLPLEDALTQFARVIADPYAAETIELRRHGERLIDLWIILKLPPAGTHPLDGFEWGIIDNR